MIAVIQIRFDDGVPRRSPEFAERWIVSLRCRAYKKALAVVVFAVRPRDGSYLVNAANSEQAIASLYARMGDQKSALDYARSAVKRMEQNHVL